MTPAAADPDRWTRRRFALPADRLARALLGQRLVRRFEDGSRLAGLIVETEAYMGVEDRACHSYAGRRTPRVEPMYMQAGTAYVYFTYGMHHCFNIVCGEIDEPVAVLIRALQPTEGLDAMRARRGRAASADDRLLCSGPARLCQALDIDRRHTGLDLVRSDSIWIETGPNVAATRAIKSGPRIGIDSAGAWAHKPFRYWFEDDPNVSR